MYCCGAEAIARARYRCARGKDGGYITRVLRAGIFGGGLVRRAEGVGAALEHGKWEGSIRGCVMGVGDEVMRCLGCDRLRREICLCEGAFSMVTRL